MRADAELLQSAVNEVARLLRADGAMIYLVDEADGLLHFAHDAGISNTTARALIRDLALPIGVGMFGTAVAARRLTVTDDYPADQRFSHSTVADQIVEAARMRSMAVAPLLANGRPIGAMGAYSSRAAAFSEPQIALLRALADHAAAAIANQRLVGQLAASEERYRTLVEGSPDVVWSTDAGGRLAFVSETVEQLTGYRADELIGQHWSVMVVPEDREDFTRLWEESKLRRGDERRARFRVLRRDQDPVTVEMRGRERMLGERGNGAHGSLRDVTDVARLEEDLRAKAEELARLVDVQRTLGEIARRIAEVDDASETLQQVVDASKRLLGSDGAHLTLMDEADANLVPMVVAGDTDPATRTWLRRQRFPIGGGINGLAAQTGAPAWTDDYRHDPRLPHDPDDDSPDRLELGAAAVAPMRGVRGEVIGTLAITYREPRPVDARDVALLEELAGQAAIAARNAGLYAKLRDSERRYRLLVDHSPDQVFETDADGRLTYLSSASEQLTGRDPGELVGHPFADVVVPEQRDELGATFARFREQPEVEQRTEFVFLRRDGSRVPVETVALGRVDDDGAFAGIHGSTRDISERARLEASLRQQAEELARSADAQRELAEIAAEISSIRDPAGVLHRTVTAARRLLVGDHALINLEPRAAQKLATHEIDSLIDTGVIPSGVGLAGTAIGQGRVLWTGDYLADHSFVHGEDADAWMRDHGYRSQISAPLPQEDGPIGALTVYATAPDAFDEADAKLLDALAGHAAVVQTNARLYAETQEAAEALAHLVEAQRSLSAIAAQISSIRDPSVVLQRTVDEARRLLGADLAIINPLDTGTNRLEWAVAFSPADEPLDDVVVPPGSGVSGTALAERRVVRTGDYLRDAAFEHSAELDAYIARRGMVSIMSAPLVAGDEPIGTLTVQAARLDAFSEDDAQLLDALAAQAAVAITNARLLEQLQGSERRYRHLVDHSPDLVWTVDADGIFTYLGEALERMTGFRREELVGRHWGELVVATSMDDAQRAWATVQQRPDEELQLRVVLRQVGGGGMAAEVNMVATTVDGRFAGAQGSIRDIRERERLDRDLRSQAAALAANEERANLARELHDSVTQALFSMGLTARALELLLDRDPEAARQKLSELRDLQKDALAEMRTLIFELRPQGLETDGLAQALRNHGAAVQGRTGLSVAVEIEMDERLPLHVEEALYRVAQEALHNVVKHANAENARIALRRSGRDLRLTVEDDGIGFDPGDVPRGHLGLVGMGQRAERIGAELEISRRPEGGTRVRVTLPLATMAGTPEAATAQ